MRIAIGTDHAGYYLKNVLRDRLRAEGHAVVDKGTHSAEPVDYPDFIRPVAEAVVRGEVDRGIVLGGSGEGECIAANKIPGIRCALCTESYTARMTREHNDSNVLALGGRVLGEELAWEIVTTWVRTEYSNEERHTRRINKIRGWEHDRRFPIRELNRLGQSIWLDYIERRLLASGDLRAMIREGLSGVTSNPTIFEKAISGSADYLDAIRTHAAAGRSPEEIVQQLMIADIRDTAAELAPIYQLSDGADGLACIELPPDLAHDTDGSLSAARRIWGAVGAPNAMIKVPGTPEGVPAIEQLIAEGINVNVTLLFALDAYEAAANAYLRGLEGRVQNGLPVDRVASVASFFVSRVDTAVDKQLQDRADAAAGPEERAGLVALQGRAAVAHSRQAYQVFQRLFAGPRWEALAARGARPQRLLWASTSTKNPAYRDVLYVEELIGPHTVNTVPPATLEALLDHGYIAPTITRDLEEARQTLAALAAAGIDMHAVTAQLLREGVKAFGGSYDALVASVAGRTRELVAGTAGR